MPKSPRSSSSSSSSARRSASSSSASAPPPIFLSLDERSFSNLQLTTHNFLHIYVGRVGHKLMVLPLILHLHSSLLSTPPPSILGRLFQHLPSLIADVNIARLKNIKDKPKLLHTDQALFTYQFNITHPTYQVMTVVNPSSVGVRRVSHPDIDSEGDEDVEEMERDGRHSSDDDEHEGMMDDDEDVVVATDEDEDDQDSRAGYYKGGKYRSFHVSQHSLYVRAIAAHEGGVREGEEGKGEEVEVERKLDKGKGKEHRKSSTDPLQSPVKASSTVEITEDDDDFL